MAKKKQVANEAVDMAFALSLSAPVSKVVQVKSIRLLECSAKCDPARMPAPQQLSITHRSRASRTGTTLHVTIDVHVHTQGDSGDPTIDISSVFLLTYEIGESHQFEQINLDAFASLNGMFNLWPYVREFVQSMTVRMGLPALTLPVYRPPTDNAKTLQAAPQNELKTAKSSKSSSSVATEKRIVR